MTHDSEQEATRRSRLIRRRVVQVVGFLALSLVLDSQWALVPAVLASVLLVVRTALEDRTLRSSLAGYADHAERVRYRLAPGVR